ncbi:MAG: transglutaminase, partial [Flavobacteriaceae bacterium]
MLREAGINANPVLISTRDNGVPMFPTRNGFNYVAAAAEIDGNTILLDATNKFAVPNLLPTQALNWFGRVIEKKGDIKTVSITPRTLSMEAYMINIDLDTEGSIEGKMRRTCTNYHAYLFRNEFANVEEDSYLERFESENNGIEISQYEISNKFNLAKPIVESFEFTAVNQADIIGEEIYLTPLFFNTTSENPFKLEERNYPIDYTFPQQEKYIVNIKIPSGYQATSIPEPIRIALENKMASFVYQIIDKETSLQIMADVKINEAVIGADHYTALKELFKKVVEKEAEKVVLSKISGNELKENTTGGR